MSNALRINIGLELPRVGHPEVRHGLGKVSRLQMLHLSVEKSN